MEKTQSIEMNDFSRKSRRSTLAREDVAEKNTILSYIHYALAILSPSFLDCKHNAFPLKAPAL